MCFVKKYKMAAEYCRVQQIFFEARPLKETKNWDLRLEQKNKFFPKVYKIEKWRTQDYKKIFIFAKMVSIWM